MTVHITLNGRINADLDWRVEMERAQTCEKVSWFLDLGLFDGLLKPLEDSWQFSALQLALDHFMDKIGDAFEEKTEEVIIFKGAVPDAGEAAFMRELFDRLPDDLPLTIQVTTNHLRTLTEKAYHLSSARFGPFKVQHDALFDCEHPIGVLLPPNDEKCEPELKKILNENSSIRLVSEERLTLEWDGLDQLYVLHPTNPISKRKIQGFQAAGGTVVDRTG